MAINPDYAGRTYPATAPYEVSRVKIAEFADAIGDPGPVFRDAAAARAAGHPDVIAPPTFAIVVSMAGRRQRDGRPGPRPGLLDGRPRRAAVQYTRPIVAGDVITAQATIDSIRSVGSLSMMTTRTEIRTTAGEHVCTAVSTLVERGK